MKILKTAAVLLAVTSLAFTVEGKVARRGVRVVRQPDGTELRVKVVGDEFMHFTTTEDGTLLHCDADGLYTYGRLDADGAVVSAGEKVTSNPAATSVRTLNIKDIDFEALAAKRNIGERRAQSVAGYTVSSAAINGKMRAPQSGVGLASTTYPRLGSPKGLIILVEYSDVKFNLQDPMSYYEDMINGDNFTQYYGTGSALQYFKDQSGGKFAPEFDIYGPVTLPNKQAYYGGNDRYGDDANAHLMVTQAIDILDDDVDFSQYDTDKDGLIDNVYIFYAGQGEADYGGPNTVWPHSYDVRYTGIVKKVDGVTVAHYACSNEWGSKTPDGIGTFVHEFSHVMGLPDLYHTAAAVYYTPCEFSVLDYGPYNNDGRTPPNYSAYELNAMGWYEPIMLDGAATVSLESIPSGDFALIPTAKTTEFFLLENRQLEGWDKYIPGHGMLIWHIDFVKSVFEQNIVNNKKDHQYVDIVEANNNPDGSSLAVQAGWTFPGSTNKTSFTSSTIPALKDWNGTAIDLPVTNISEIDGVIVFDVKGGKGRLAVPTPTYDQSDISSRHFVAKWDAVPGATDYYLTVYGVTGGTPGTITNSFDNSTYGEGWESSVTNNPFYTTVNNYGETSPSYKFSNNGQTLTSSTAPADISKIEFWAKGQTTRGSGTSLLISGLVNGVWKDIATIVPSEATAGAKVTVEAGIPLGVRQLRFTLNKVQGNIALDDIVITYGGQNAVLEHYNNILTGGATTVRVDKLISDCSEYYFTVQATDGKQRSTVSAPVTVSLSDLGAVGDITVDQDAPARYYNLQGVEIKTPTPGTIVIERRGSQSRKVLVK